MLPVLLSARARRGFNLIEMAIVLGVIGLVVGGIYVASAAVRDNRRIEEVYSGMSQAVDNLQRQYPPSIIPNVLALSGGPNTAFTNTTLNALGIFPANWWNTSCSVFRSPFSLDSASCSSNIAFNGSVTDTVGGRSVLTIFLLIKNIPRNACIRLASRLSKMIPDKLYSINMAGCTGTSGCPTNYTAPMTPSQVNTACTTVSSKYVIMEQQSNYQIILGVRLN